MMFGHLSGKKFSALFVIVPCAFQIAFGGIVLKSDDTASITLNGFGALQNGEIVKGHYKEYNLSHLWLQKAFVNLSVDAILHKNLRLSLGMEGKAWRDEAKQNYNTEWEVPQKYYTFYISQAEAEYSFEKLGPLSITAGGGVFPYKYNPDVRNLGEFLFRSGTYPGWIINEFDMPFARLTGLKVGTNLFGSIQQDLLLTSETEMPPAYDFSLSYLGKYNFRNIFELGWGVELARILPINGKETTPHNWENVIEIKNGRQVVVYDSANNVYDTSIVGDTVFYTFTGIKPMVRFSFDPKPFLPESILRFLNKDDLRIYAEAVVLGLKNQGTDYDTLKQRIPVMFGLNIPTGKILDLLSLEFEYYSSPYPNSYQRIVFGGDRNPTRPLIVDPIMYLPDYSKDTWKWSIYAKRSFGTHFSVIAQAARDHIFTAQNFGDTQDREESLIKPGHWWWVLKLVSNL